MNARTIARRSAVGLVALLATVVSTSHSEHRVGSLDVTVVAVATPAEPSASDDAVKVARLGGRSSTVQSKPTATSDCDGCSATGSAVTVAYVNGAGATRAGQRGPGVVLVRRLHIDDRVGPGRSPAARGDSPRRQPRLRRERRVRWVHDVQAVACRASSWRPVGRSAAAPSPSSPAGPALRLQS